MSGNEAYVWWCDEPNVTPQLLKFGSGKLNHASPAAAAPLTWLIKTTSSADKSQCLDPTCNRQHNIHHISQPNLMKYVKTEIITCLFTFFMGIGLQGSHVLLACGGTLVCDKFRVICMGTQETGRYALIFGQWPETDKHWFRYKDVFQILSGEGFRLWRPEIRGCVKMSVMKSCVYTSFASHKYISPLL